MRKYFFHTLLIALFSCLTLCPAAHANISRRPDVEAFIAQMNAKYSFPKADLYRLFSTININLEILALMDRPAEKKPWHQYRTLMLTDQRLQWGLAFWKEHEKTLAEVEKRYGVPAHIIVAIIGVETTYGRNVGHHKVLEALATLGFEGYNRNEFFLSELEQFLLLSRELHWDTANIKGSYAGAIGIPQFMPSNIRKFGVRYGQNRLSLVEDPDSAIASIGNYLHHHGWKLKQSIIVPAVLSHNAHVPEWGKQGEYSLSTLKKWGIEAKQAPHIQSSDKTGVLALEAQSGLHQHWIALPNFFSIMRYNKSPMYAMAVAQLGHQLRKYHEPASTVVPIPAATKTVTISKSYKPDRIILSKNHSDTHRIVLKQALQKN